MLKETKVFIFTRHALTPGQMAALTNIVFADTLFSEGITPVFQTEAASATLKTDADAQEVIATWIHPQTETVVFGVFPPIIRAELLSMHVRHQGGITLWDAPCSVRLFEAHSVNRAAEGEKPSFEFVEWLETAEYNFQEESNVKRT